MLVTGFKVAADHKAFCEGGLGSVGPCGGVGSFRELASETGILVEEFLALLEVLVLFFAHDVKLVDQF